MLDDVGVQATDQRLWDFGLQKLESAEPDSGAPAKDRQTRTAAAARGFDIDDPRPTLSVKSTGIDGCIWRAGISTAPARGASFQVIVAPAAKGIQSIPESSALLHLSRKTMDAKANTNFCVSPIMQFDGDVEPAESQAAYLIVVSGGMPGTMHSLSDRGTSVGRSAENALQLDDITISRRHAFVSIDKGGKIRIRDEGSTNGTFLNGQRVPVHCLRELDDGDRIQLGTTLVLKLVRLDPNEERFQREMFERTVRDSLTSLYNRAYFIDQVGALTEKYAGLGLGMAILMIDVDHFKRINDSHGHVAGDSVLKEVAGVIRESTRAEDLVARYGGEEFIVALPVSDPDLAIERAERIRRNLAGRPVWVGTEQIRVTASIGLAFSPPSRIRSDRIMIVRADQALYKAKAEGRDRVVFGQIDALPNPTKTESVEFAAYV